MNALAKAIRTSSAVRRHTAGEGAAHGTLMTLREVAAYLRVTRSTIHRMLKRNEIPAFRIGRHWRFNLEEIDNWCASHALSKEPKRDV
jgi:excisionase family DNA binding protein